MKKIRFGMSYKSGDIVLVKFPFTNLKKSKKRPVLVIKNESNFNDIVCFQITSNAYQSSLLKIDEEYFKENKLPLTSYIKYDKCFTLSSEIVDKKLTSLNQDILNYLKELFCKEIF